MLRTAHHAPRGSLAIAETLCAKIWAMLFLHQTNATSPRATRALLTCIACASLPALLLHTDSLANGSQLAPVPPPPRIEVLMQRASAAQAGATAPLAEPSSSAPAPLTERLKAEPSAAPTPSAAAQTASPPVQAPVLAMPPAKENESTLIPSGPSSVASPQPAATPVPPAPPLAPPVASDTAQRIQAVEATVRDWAAAWSTKDVDAYLGFYAPNFVPPGKQQRSQWERERRNRILKNSAIVVRVSQLDIRVAGTHAVARFQQEYQAPTLAVSSAKELRFTYSSGRWRIIKETVIP